MTPGEIKTFQVSMKDDAPVETVRGKLVDFTVNLHMGMRTEPAALDDNLATKLGFSTYADLERAVSGSASSQMQQKEKSMLNNQVFSRLLENSKVEIPQWLTDMEAQNLMRNRGVDFSALPKEQKDMIRQDAEKAVKLSLILDAVRETEPETYFSEKELVDSLRAQVQESGQDPDEFIQKTLNDGSLFGIIANMKDSATIDWIVSNSSIVE
jgi:trigger factor